MAVGNYSSPRRREYALSRSSEIVPYQIAEGLKYAAYQRVFFLLDLDETTFTGCLRKHDRAYRLWASIIGYTGNLPDFQHVAKFGRARLAYEQYLPNAACLENRMRGAKVAHQLEPMHPEIEKLVDELSKSKLRPSLSITARPQHLETFSRDELLQTIGIDVPVYAMPKEIPLAHSGDWKLKQLLLIKQQLQAKNKLRPIILFDDSYEVNETINTFDDPDIFCVRYMAEPNPHELEANWVTIQAKLLEIQSFWQQKRNSSSRRHR